MPSPVDGDEGGRMEIEIYLPMSLRALRLSGRSEESHLYAQGKLREAISCFGIAEPVPSLS